MCLCKRTLLTLMIVGLTVLSWGLPVAAQPKSGGDYPIQPVPFTAVKVTDQFWAPRIRLNHDITIPIALKHCYSTGRVDNFLVAGHRKPGTKFCTEYPFDDTDIYKIIEGASYSLQTFPDKKLDAQIDSLITYVASAQEPDGYLYTARTIDPAHPHPWSGLKRWEKESDLSHELYNSGHLFEAAVAHYQATGKKTLLTVAIKNADLLVKDFGPGKLSYSPGHQIVEMGLVKLYRTTGKKEYLDLAKFLLDVRGKGNEYSQDHKPVVQQTEAVGHSVRATYMYSGMADVAAIMGNKAYVNAIDKIWQDVVYDKYYITGGIGAQGGHEGFGPAFELPNMSAYNETCAAIGNIYWNQRLFLLHGNAKFYDVLERTLYNGMLSGVSLSGDRFFYPNPLESKGQHSRSAWFGCACCPSNVCRFIPSMPGYVYAQRGNRLYVNLFVESEASITLDNLPLKITQETRYPWGGDVAFTVNPTKAKAFELAIRIPGWAQNQPVPGNLYAFTSQSSAPVMLTVNGKQVAYNLEDGYAILSQTWKKGDVVRLSLPMEVRRVKASERVKADLDKVALERGPIMYCAEWPDSPDGHVLDFVLPAQATLQTEFKPDVLGGVAVISGSVEKVKRGPNGELETRSATLTAIPYYAWANRGAGEMAVWMGTRPAAAKPTPAPTIASTSKITASFPTKALVALNDQDTPKNSNDHDNMYYHWWPKKDTVQWVQYTFDKPATVSSSKVYWFDDSPWGGCRIPASWKLLYQTSTGDWKEVKTTKPYIVNKDQFDEVTFEPVQTTALRMEVQLPKEASAGILEWSVQ
ncbi:MULTISPECIES: glycoside hydrolase family 127 protein [unclassified Spirosoma]|uniref:glycoside hydrolase family 127 protein n=1 Tax=unclassified Spirosoma TaxID=2621999 RepID=UPI0009649E1F|nr:MULTISPECIES: glycoside hydrolase family 127 protein [unclassified Spirosoma]OJW76423.1 MAG: six-hairpin glycosidase [Spirosoma sp. 48-14]